MKSCGSISRWRASCLKPATIPTISPPWGTPLTFQPISIRLPSGSSPGKNSRGGAPPPRRPAREERAARRLVDHHHRLAAVAVLRQELPAAHDADPQQPEVARRGGGDPDRLLLVGWQGRPADGEGEGFVLAAERQSEGGGRRGGDAWQRGSPLHQGGGEGAELRVVRVLALRQGDLE